MEQGEGSTSNGQRSTPNAFPRAFYLEHGHNGVYLRLDQNNLAPADALVPDGQHSAGWMSQSSSSTNTEGPFQFMDLLTRDGLLSPPHTDAGTHQRLQERQHEPNTAVFRQSSSVNLVHGQVTYGLQVLQGTSSSALHQNIDLNAAYEGNGIDGNQDMGTSLSLNSLRLGGVDTYHNALPSDGSNFDPLMISSGSAGYVLEENEGGEGSSSDGRRLSCKRRAPEVAFEQFHFGGSSGSAQQVGSSQQQAIAVQGHDLRGPSSLDLMNSHQNFCYSGQFGAEQVVGAGAAAAIHQTSGATGSGLGVGAGASSNMHQILSVGQAEHSQRNIRLRRSPSQQDFAHTNLSTWTTMNPHVRSTGQPTVFSPFDLIPNRGLASGIVPPPPPPPMQPLVHVPISQHVQPFQCSGIVGQRTGGPSSSAYAINGGDALHQEGSSWDGPRNGMFPQEFQRGNLAQVPSDMNLANGRNFNENIASGSRSSPGSRVVLPSAPTRFPLGNMAEQNAQRISELANRTESRRQGGYCPIHSGPAAAAAREVELRVRGATARPSQVPIRLGLTPRAVRQASGHPEMAFRSLTAAQRRSRVVSEVRNALALVRRGGALQFEDVMVIGRSVLYGVPGEVPDTHEGMRLDVDNMTYEELLALEEQIGNVSTGLSEDAIRTHLRRRKFQSIAPGSPKDEPCCICQEEYKDGEELGKLDCGHDFHFNCIKQWLVQKNNCPICKKTALNF